MLRPWSLFSTTVEVWCIVSFDSTGPTANQEYHLTILWHLDEAV